MVLAGIPLCLPGLMVGAMSVRSLSFYEGLGATALGCLVLTLYGGLIGSVGARTGKDTTTLLGEPFGELGAKAIGGLLGICLAGWYAVQTEFFGRTIHAMFPSGGFLTSVEGAALWGGLLMLSSALFGFKGLARLSVIAVPLILILTALALYELSGAVQVYSESSGSFWRCSHDGDRFVCNWSHG